MNSSSSCGGLAVGLERSGFDAAHAQQVGDEAVETLGLVASELEQLVAGALVVGGAVAQVGRDRADGGQRACAGRGTRIEAGLDGCPRPAINSDFSDESRSLSSESAQDLVGSLFCGSTAVVGEGDEGGDGEGHGGEGDEGDHVVDEVDGEPAVGLDEHDVEGEGGDDGGDHTGDSVADEAGDDAGHDEGECRGGDGDRAAGRQEHEGARRDEGDTYE